MLLNGVMPHGYNRCRLQLLFFCLIVTDLHSPVVVLIYSVDAIPLRFPVSLLLMQSISDSIVYGFLLQNPVQSPIPSISCSTEFWIVCYLYTFASYAAIGACADTGCLISFISFPDHKLSRFSERYKSPLGSCRLSQPVTASFSVDCCFGLCNTHAAV